MKLSLTKKLDARFQKFIHASRNDNDIRAWTGSKFRCNHRTILCVKMMRMRFEFVVMRSIVLANYAPIVFDQHVRIVVGFRAIEQIKNESAA